MKDDRKTVDLGGGWTMTGPLTRKEAVRMYFSLDGDELEELDAVRCGMKEFVTDCMSADRSAAVYAGRELVFTICGNWVENPLGGGQARAWDTMCSRAIREKGLARAFVEKTPKIRDAFIADEPVKDVWGVVKSDFARSRKWASRVAGFTEAGEVELFGVRHTLYRYVEKVRG